MNMAIRGASRLGALALHRGSARVSGFGLRYMSSWPEHTVLSLPALSPTMEKGGIMAWTLNEGDAISAGAAICEIETDKASMDFEAQDDGFLARILVEAGTSDIPVGSPIGIVVEDEGDIAAFSSYTLADAGGGASPAGTEKKNPAPPASKAEKVETPSPVQEKPAETPPPSPSQSPVGDSSAPSPLEASPPTPQVQPVAAAQAFPTFSSPLKKVIEKERTDYEALYGRTLMFRPNTPEQSPEQ
mmetsp:Transcript_10226/g.18026  ORF Transcript_10226/g.18026 Transcript_10226/m.18026 type:complete len:244 (-) Transcript_10226:44-775(-)